MADATGRQAFEAQVADLDAAIAASAVAGVEPTEMLPRFVERAAAGSKAGDLAAAADLSAAFARVAFVTPEAITAVYDAFARGWLGLDATSLVTPPPQAAAAALLRERATIPVQLWREYWGIVEDAAGQISAGEITARVAALAGDLPPSFRDRAEAAARAHPGSAGAAAREVPPPLRLATLAEQPEGSLGHAFHRLIVDNGFDLEVLDRDAIGLRALPPALRYLNTRILQMHDVWHLVGGYATTALHEIAISAFQLAQFGHNYSAMFLATIATASRVNFPPGLPVILQVIAEAWRHGRLCPPLMAIAWEREWHRPVAEIRARFAIRPFASAFPADLIEQARALKTAPERAAAS